MKHLLLLFLSVVFLTACSGSSDCEPTGGDGKTFPTETFTTRKLVSQTLYCRTLGKEVKYNVLLPESYLSGSDSNRYPVMYLLHGYGDNPDAWLGSLNIQRIADEQFKKGGCREIIYVMPEGYNSYYCNRYDGSFDYMKMFCDELIPLIDKRFRTVADASSRAVAGYSMGGFGALTLAMQHPELFGISIALSPSMNTDSQYSALSQDGFNIQWGSVFGGKGMAGTSRITSYYKSQCPLHLVADKSQNFSSVHFFVDCGDDEERLYDGSGELHCMMLSRGINHEYRVRNGAHTTAYWTAAMPEALRFVESCLRGEAYSSEDTRLFDNAKSTKKTIAVGDCSVTLRLPVGYDATKEYSVVYAPMDDHGDISESDMASVFDSLMTKRRVVLATFPVGKSADMDNIVSQVEAQVTTNRKPQSRMFLVTCDGCESILRFVNSKTPLFASLYIENCRFNVADDLIAGEYYIDTVDDSANANSIHSLFCKMRKDGVAVEYRVRNGKDTKTSKLCGIYNLTTLMNKYISL